MPNVSFTPCATSVSTNASDGVMRILPVDAAALASAFDSAAVFFMDRSPYVIDADTAHRARGRRDREK